MRSQVFFRILAKDPLSRARVGVLNIRGRRIFTPVFMPVGTQGTVKTVAPWELEQIGYDLVLSNTYHLYLRPGPEFFREFPDLHRFMSWPGAILTDSGGYQVFSLAKLRRISENGVEFSSHIDGSRIFFSPEVVMDFQLNLIGSDIVMPLDECLPYPVSKRQADSSLTLTNRWLSRAIRFWQDQGGGEREQYLFGIVQGAYYKDLRKRACEELVGLNLPGYAIGGLSVGEPEEVRWEMTAVCTEVLPEDRPRYLMGVGTPEDIQTAVKLGVDMFDCVIPTRYGRTGVVFTKEGKLNIRNSRFRKDLRVLEEGCGCPACQRGISRGYLRHLFMAGEVLGIRLLTLHNLYYYYNLLENIRRGILERAGVSLSGLLEEEGKSGDARK